MQNWFQAFLMYNVYGLIIKDSSPYYMITV